MKTAEEWVKQIGVIDPLKIKHHHPIQRIQLQQVKAIQADAERSGYERAKAEIKSIPVASQDENRSGWTLQYSLLDEVTDVVNSKSEDGICIEHTEAVILELSKRGYVILAKLKQP